jgi:hypothetical protein
MMFLVVLFAIGFVTSIFIREDNARFSVDLEDSSAPVQV